MNMIDYKYHQNVTKILNNQIQNDKISQAYLFCGTSSTLKEEVASIFARSINNLESDKKYSTNPDITIYKPKGVNGYLIGQIKELLSDSNRAPMSCKWKVNIIADAEKFNTSSANAFLKTLEEPPPYIVNILLASNEQNVLPTICSRCQLIRFKDLPSADLQEIVQQKTCAAPAHTNKALRYYAGNLNKSINFLQTQNLIDIASYTENVMKQLQSDYVGNQNVLDYSQNIVQAIQDSSKSYKQDLEKELAEKSEVLEGAALKEIEKENKRKVSNYQNDIMCLVTSVVANCVETSVRENINKDNDNASLKLSMNTLDSIVKMQRFLSYNVSLQNYCDVLLMKVKNDNNSSD